MKSKWPLFAWIIAVLVTAALLAFWYRESIRPRISVRGFAWDSQLNAMAVLPLTADHKAVLATLVRNARQDPAAARQLLNTVRDDYRVFGIRAERSKPGLFSARCPNGPIFAYNLDKEGWIYFAFAEVHGATTVTLEENGGINLLRQ